MIPTIKKAIGVASVLAAAAAGLNAGKPTADIPLKMNLSAGAADRITSDGLTATGYADAYVDGVENVMAIIQSSGNFRFTTRNETRLAATRRLCIDFAGQFADQGKPVPFADGNPRQCVDVTQPMHAYASVDIAIMSLRYGQSVDKLTRFGWEDAGWQYRLGYGTDMNRDGVTDAPPVRVTCIAPADTNAACTKWVLAPALNGEAVLYRFPIKRGTVQESDGELVALVVMPYAETFEKK